MTYLTGEQVTRLLAPINPARVETLPGKGSLSYVSQHDIRAHMNRIFGFGRWSTEVKATDFIFEEQDGNNRWKAAYRAVVRVEVRSPDGTLLAHYEDAHVSGNAPQPDRAEAHALALTSAVSTAFKRACTNLGDQFGLSLYEKGQRTALVKGTLVQGAIAEALDKAADDAGIIPDFTVSDAVTAITLEILDLANEKDSAKRITSIAGLKAKHAAMLDAITQIDDTQITLGLLADHVAAGKDIS